MSAASTPVIDPVELTRDLIRRPSVTPADEGAMDVLERVLAGLGFHCRRMPFEGIENLYARRGTAGPNLCFAGHTDVVPTGSAEAWSSGPFEAEVKDGVLYGRGAVDMKGGIAAWVAAVSRVLAQGEVPGSLSFLITGDEEGPALHGTKRVVETLMAEGEVIDACVVGEPSSQQALGDMIKIGRRGSLNSWITVHGKQGHVAYPDRAANPAPVMARLMARLADHRLDDGYQGFQPSNLEITTIDIGNPATNVIPAEAKARLNIRFNPNHTGDELIAWLNAMAGEAQAASGLRIELEHLCSGNAFLTEPGPFIEGVQDAVEAATGRRPEASTTGGTSDARFIRAMCPVLELGLVGQTMHQIDERAPVAEIEALAEVYRAVIGTYFERV
ncbi:MAG: succinyl-diaminopimelate desuccinylase [Alphaproteobacteria bacterium]|jgi:succinyl-diaminopimelate desuccinylase|nr:succinyl-diaminopimelate desuccinylase [Alphaproteobacteria bacterium]MBU2040426.1 succinyl-diaminopimelate desuccinylase [Alphaproteobacteria bacterium]MBU2126432.1 succinyl-diaminopimelate desuccinylase [Alphaproteobacteria bacterium]MBU2209015.1 succinyl-diaminopimelate desuccinylase [Alphaproteobacteria bacterium]MBU2291650.1 succinyl-diaminopimelate desuccinylase [Alphaproteobacteria bacterium]